MAQSRENRTSLVVVQAALEVHQVLGGPGLLEAAYEEALVCELQLRGVPVQRQVPVPLRYKGHQLATALRVDLLVDDCLIVECKAASKNNPVFAAQALTYLRITGLRLALVINFGQTLLKHGTERVANGVT
jgi:GxxExxY protein